MLKVCMFLKILFLFGAFISCSDICPKAGVTFKPILVTQDMTTVDLVRLVLEKFEIEVKLLPCIPFL